MEKFRKMKDIPMSKRLHNVLIGFLALLVVAGAAGMVLYNDFSAEGIAPKIQHRKIDVELIDRQIREGNLSDVPARHFRVLKR